MSHLITLKTQLKDMGLVQRLAKKHGLTLEWVDHYCTPYGQTAQNVWLLKQNSNVVLVIDKDGMPIVDDMSTLHQQFMQDYAKEFLLGHLHNGLLQEETVAANGDLILKIAML